VERLEKTLHDVDLVVYITLNAIIGRIPGMLVSAKDALAVCQPALFILVIEDFSTQRDDEASLLFSSLLFKASESSSIWTRRSYNPLPVLRFVAQT
jgi:hypothetical protein